MLKLRRFLVALCVMMLCLTGCSQDTKPNQSHTDHVEQQTEQQEQQTEQQEQPTEQPTEQPSEQVTLDAVPEYTGVPYVEIQNNEPQFSEEEMKGKAFESYSSLDNLERCGVAEANIGKELMPTEKRGAIGQVKPSGWHTVKYDHVDGKYLYNRCHLIGYQLTAENANDKNLITGTRYMNVDGMLPFENMVADYIHETGNHVRYRVTPVYENNNLVASGVQMEAKSVEDQGAGVCFNVFVYNVQPGVEIDYATGESQLSGTVDVPQNDDVELDYIVNMKTRKFHDPNCSSVKDMSEGNMKKYRGSRSKLMENGYDPCGRCKP